MYTIEIEDLLYSGTLFDVTKKYLALKHMLGGDYGYANFIKVTDPHGQTFDMENWIEGARRLFGVDA